MSAFEYKVLDISRNNFSQDEESLNEYGAEGWRLVGITDNAAYLERKREEADRG